MVDRNKLAIEMVKNLQTEDQVFVNEVAMPGVRPDDVKEEDKQSYIKDNDK